MKYTLEELKEQAQELIDGGNSHEKAKGQGMMEVINSLSPPKTIFERAKERAFLSFLSKSTFEKVQTTNHGELLFDGDVFICEEAKKVFITRADTEGDEEEIDIIETTNEEGEAIGLATYKIVSVFFFNDFLNIAEEIKRL